MTILLVLDMTFAIAKLTRNAMQVVRNTIFVHAILVILAVARMYAILHAQIMIPALATARAVAAGEAAVTALGHVWIARERMIVEPAMV